MIQDKQFADEIVNWLRSVICVVDEIELRSPTKSQATNFKLFSVGISKSRGVWRRRLDLLEKKMPRRLLLKKIADVM